jgi:hypothetical protein
MSQEPLKVFISYESEDEAHNRWVERFATDLRAAGIDATLDTWDVRFGDSFTDYMTSKIKKADVVLFIMTTRSVAAAEAPQGLPFVVGARQIGKGAPVSPSLSNSSAIVDRQPRMNPRKFKGFGLKPGKIAPRLVAPR